MYLIGVLANKLFQMMFGLFLQIHEEFKELVDELIAGYLEDLGISVEDFYETVCAAGPDKLTNLVISTVLLADDFPQFRALMMKRNLELSNQVLFVT